MRKKILGINGLGRVGKLILWTKIFQKEFDEIVVNFGRDVGCSFDDVIDYIVKDSTYGRLDAYLFGAASRQSVEVRGNEAKRFILINGVKINILTTHRNPKEIDWRGAEIIIDTPGKFNFPDRDKDHPKGSVRGHFDNPTVKKVVISSPFKLDEGDKLPKDSTMVVLGINGHDYKPKQHHIISNASCTTTCLVHMFKPLLQCYGPSALTSFAMDTIHAETGKQTVLDCVPAAGESDPCKSRSAFNNIFLTTTGAANAIKYVLPEIAEVPFIAQSIRVPTITGSLVVLTSEMQPQNDIEPTKENINRVYKKLADVDTKGYLRFSSERNVSSDIIGSPAAATIIEGSQTQAVVVGEARTNSFAPQKIRVFGWYDNELGSYVNMLSDQISVVAASIE